MTSVYWPVSWPHHTPPRCDWGRLLSCWCSAHSVTVQEGHGPETSLVRRFFLKKKVKQSVQQAATPHRMKGAKQGYSWPLTPTWGQQSDGETVVLDSGWENRPVFKTLQISTPRSCFAFRPQINSMTHIHTDLHRKTAFFLLVTKTARDIYFSLWRQSGTFIKLSEFIQWKMNSQVSGRHEECRKLTLGWKCLRLTAVELMPTPSENDGWNSRSRSMKSVRENHTNLPSKKSRWQSARRALTQALVLIAMSNWRTHFKSF